MELEQLRQLVQRALVNTSAERIAADAGGITAKSVLNFASRSVVKPRNDQRLALERWADRLSTARVVREVGPEYGAVPGVTDQSWQLVMTTMVAQARLVFDLAEKTREAQEPVLRFLEGLQQMYRQPVPTAPPPTPDVTGEELEAATARQLRADAKAARKTASG